MQSCTLKFNMKQKKIKFEGIASREKKKKTHVGHTKT